jgi:hypothetical protein
MFMSLARYPYLCAFIIRSWKFVKSSWNWDGVSIIEVTGSHGGTVVTVLLLFNTVAGNFRTTTVSIGQN